MVEPSLGAGMCASKYCSEPWFFAEMVSFNSQNGPKGSISPCLQMGIQTQKSEVTCQSSVWACQSSVHILWSSILLRIKCDRVWTSEVKLNLLEWAYILCCLSWSYRLSEYCVAMLGIIKDVCKLWGKSACCEMNVCCGLCFRSMSVWEPWEWVPVFWASFWLR